MPSAAAPPACKHSWIIATPNGPTVRGACKRCGAKRDWPSAGKQAPSEAWRPQKEAEVV